MRKPILVAVSLALLCFAVSGFARDAIDNGQLQIKPYKQDRFETGAYRMGKAELFGYVGALKDSDHITGMVLLNGDHASTEQKHIVAVIAKAQKIEAIIELDGKMQPLVDPTPPLAAPAPPVEPAVTTQPAQQAQPAQAASAAAPPAQSSDSD
ncbi:MAG: hypothetical protein ABI304_07535 [Rudaea sp.]